MRKKKKKSTKEVRPNVSQKSRTSPYGFVDQFIAPGGEADEEEDVNRRAANHARLDRRDREFDDQELSQIAQNLSKRYGRTTVRYTGDMNEVPQRLLMPSVNDPSLWQVRVKVSTRMKTVERYVLTAEQAWPRTRYCFQPHAQSY